MVSSNNWLCQTLLCLTWMKRPNEFSSVPTALISISFCLFKLKGGKLRPWNVPPKITPIWMPKGAKKKKPKYLYRFSNFIFNILGILNSPRLYYYSSPFHWFDFVQEHVEPNFRMAYWSERAMISQMQIPCKQGENWGCGGHARNLECQYGVLVLRLQLWWWNCWCRSIDPYPRSLQLHCVQ